MDKAKIGAHRCGGLVCAGTSHAAYNDNFTTRITEVLTYDNGLFLIATATMPNGQPYAGYWIVPGDVPANARQMLLSRALIARKKGEPIKSAMTTRHVSTAGIAFIGWGEINSEDRGCDDVETKPLMVNYSGRLVGNVQ